MSGPVAGGSGKLGAAGGVLSTTGASKVAGSMTFSDWSTAPLTVITHVPSCAPLGTVTVPVQRPFPSNDPVTGAVSACGAILQPRESRPYRTFARLHPRWPM